MNRAVLPAVALMVMSLTACGKAKPPIDCPAGMVAFDNGHQVPNSYTSTRNSVTTGTIGGKKVKLTTKVPYTGTHYQSNWQCRNTQ